MVVDNFSIFFKVIFLLAAGLVLLSAESLHRAGRRERGRVLRPDPVLHGRPDVHGLRHELMTIYLALEISSLSLAFLAAWNKRELRSS